MHAHPLGNGGGDLAQQSHRPGDPVIAQKDLQDLLLRALGRVLPETIGQCRRGPPLLQPQANLQRENGRD